MPSKKQTIDNPFKERRIPWVRYGLLLSLALVVTLVFVSYDMHQTHRRKGRFQPNLVAGSHAAVKDDDVNNNNQDAFPELDASEFPEWLNRYLHHLDWHQVASLAERAPGGGLSKPVLQRSLQLGCANIKHNQKEAGNFNYQYNFVTQEMDPTDSQVRNVGALWGLVLCHQHFQSLQQPEHEEYIDALAGAIDRAIEFFEETLMDGPEKGTLLVQYPNTLQSYTVGRRS